MKTDLKKILSISGQPGLFLYLSQAKNGVIVESLITKQRTAFGSNSKVTSLADISIYTNAEEVSLKDVLKNMAIKLGEDAAPSHKSDPKAIKSFFEEVLPDYDRDRFYVSHMKKVLEWYTILKQYASLDFEEEEEEEEEKSEETPAEAQPQEK
ncbi:MAG: DUF5606 domain-containing protein [Bacteroidales bacterium]|nr:DUF5606 domain-containing protein [Bacteroidales bacterium]MDD4671135.1 DUF5606 domain-containing protein [Bacteroidales bacterium]